MRSKKEEPPKGRTGFQYPLLGISLPLCVFLGYLAGRFMDNLFGTGPILLIAGIVLGVAAGYTQLFQLIKKD